MLPETVKGLCFCSMIATMYILESIWPMRPWKTKHSFRLGFHLLISIFNVAILRLITIGPLFYLLQWGISNQWGLSYRLGIFGGWEIICSIVLYDFLDYWWHRWNHVVPFLWRFHRLHHTDTHVDSTTALRFHPGELFFSALFKGIWIFLWGPSLWGLIGAEIVISTFSQFHHSNFAFVPKTEAWLTKVIITPVVHASHHNMLSKIRNHNYSTVLSLWDRLFGSYHLPLVSDSKELGVEDLRQEKSAYSITKFFFGRLKLKGNNS